MDQNDSATNHDQSPVSAGDGGAASGAAANGAAANGAAPDVTAEEHGSGADFSGYNEDDSSMFFRDRSFPLGSISGVRIRMHWLLPVEILLASVVGAGHDGATGFGTDVLLYGPIVMAAVLINGVCTCWQARKSGATVEQLMLWPLGGVASTGNFDSADEDITVAMAGPLSHIPQIFLFLVLCAAVNGGNVAADSIPYKPSSGFWTYLFFHSMTLNMTLLALNLLMPCYPMNGGRILADFLLMRGWRAGKIAKLVVFISIPLVVGLFALAIVLLTDGNGSAIMTIITALWMSGQVRSLWRMIRDETIDEHPQFAHPREWDQKQPNIYTTPDPYNTSEPAVAAV